MADSINDMIEQLATEGVQSAAVDGRTAAAVPLPDLIAADKHVAAKSSAARRGRGLRFTKLLKGGHTDDRAGGCR